MNKAGRETKRNQSKKRVVVHPRGLARAVAHKMGAGKEDWRDKVAGLPEKGRKYLHPELHRNRT